MELSYGGWKGKVQLWAGSALLKGVAGLSPADGSLGLLGM